MQDLASYGIPTILLPCCLGSPDDPGSPTNIHRAVSSAPILLALVAPPALTGQVSGAGPTGFQEAAENGTVVLGENETRVMMLDRDRVVHAETIGHGDVDVIIELRGTPVRALNGAGASRRAELRARHRAALEETSSAVVGLVNAARANQHRAAIPQGDVIRRQYLEVFLGLAARVPEDVLADLERLPGVRRWVRDREVRATLGSSVPLIQADRVWNSLGATGRGVRVAVIDTGVDYTHPDLGGCLGPACKVIGGFDFLHNDDDPMDDNGHGTHVGGIVAADGEVTGVAPDARLLAYKVLGSSGFGLASAAIAALERAVDPDGDPATADAAHVANLSLGGSGDPDDPLSQAVDNAVLAGLVVVVAAGNTGPDYQTVNSPAVARRSLAVGATDKFDRIARFSSRGFVPGTYQVKPELTAPGVGILSTVPTGACSLCDPSGHRVLDGTSMAAPHVAGAAALLRELFPSWTAEEIRDSLIANAVPLGLDVMTQGAGRIDVWEAATARTVLGPAVLSLGLDVPEPGVFSRRATLTLANRSSQQRTYALSTSGAPAPGVVASVAPASLTLAPGQQETFDLDLIVDNSVAPNVNAEPFAYEAAVLASSGTQVLRAPFTFLKAPVLEADFSSRPFFLLLFPSGGLMRWFDVSGTTIEIPLPEGTYDLLTGFDTTTWVAREGLAVTSRTQLEVQSSEAVHSLSLDPVDQEGEPLSLDSGPSTYLFEHRPTASKFGLMSTAAMTDYHLSEMSDVFTFEASLAKFPTQPGAPTYTINAHAREGVHGSTVFRNEPGDFRHVKIRHTPDPGAGRIFVGHFFSALSVSITHCTPGGLTYPFEEDVYFLPLPYPEFNLGHVSSHAFRSTPDPFCVWSQRIYSTPRTRAVDRERLVGEPIFSYEPAVLSTTADLLRAGIGPYFWYAKFSNSDYQILIKRDPFLSQLGDQRPFTTLPYEVVRNGAVVRSGSRLPASIAVTPAAYTVNVSYGDFVLAGEGASARVSTTFNTMSGDPDPPYLASFKVLIGDEAVDAVPPSGVDVVFEALDAAGPLGSVVLSYDQGGGWQDAQLQVSGNERRASIVPGNSLPIALRMTAADRIGNRLEYTVSGLPVRNRAALTVVKQGTGQGTVTSRPSGIDCGEDCSETYFEHVVVSLTPEPEAGSVFDGWSGHADCFDGAVSLNQEKTCTATFTDPSKPFFSDGFESGDLTAWPR